MHLLYDLGVQSAFLEQTRVFLDVLSECFRSATFRGFSGKVAQLFCCFWPISIDLSCLIFVFIFCISTDLADLLAGFPVCFCL